MLMSELHKAFQIVRHSMRKMSKLFFGVGKNPASQTDQQTLS
jgi:hypothetical protein